MHDLFRDVLSSPGPRAADFWALLERLWDWCLANFQSVMQTGSHATQSFAGVQTTRKWAPNDFFFYT